MNDVELDNKVSIKDIDNYLSLLPARGIDLYLEAIMHNDLEFRNKLIPTINEAKRLGLIKEYLNPPYWELGLTKAGKRWVKSK